ncbi:hypothetical protein [Novosphingobium ovatum]|nr:hypothetical protein [Novosphingobium ovatum]
MTATILTIAAIILIAAGSLAWACCAMSGIAQAATNAVENNNG